MEAHVFSSQNSRLYRAITFVNSIILLSCDLQCCESDTYFASQYRIEADEGCFDHLLSHCIKTVLYTLVLMMSLRVPVAQHSCHLLILAN